MTFEHVIGVGQMGTGIAEVVAASGRQVSLHRCPLLRQYVATGRLGRKCGRGSYEY